MLQSCLLMQNTDAPEAVSDDIPAPSRSEIIQCLGSPLAEIFLEYIRPKKQNFCSSGDYNAAEFQERNYDQFLQTQTALRPPPIDPKVKALTHEGILTLGQQLLDKFEAAKNQKSKDQAQQDLAEARYIFAAEKRRALDTQEKKLRLEHEKCYSDLFMQLKRKLEVDLEKAKCDYNRNLKDGLIKERLDVMHEMMQKVSDEMSDIIVTLCKHFEKNLIKERANMIKIFNFCLSVERDVSKQQIEEIERQRIRDLFYMRQDLETQNLTNLTFMLCLEKIKYNQKVKKLDCCFKKKVEILQNLLSSLIQASQHSSKKEASIQETEIQFYKCKLLELIKQFKKLIDFSFDEVPGQADFLFDLDSFVSLTSHLDNNQKKPPEETEMMKMSEVVVDCENRHWVPIQSLLEILRYQDISSCDFEHNIYTSEDDPNEEKSLLELIEEKGNFFIQYQN